MADPIVQEAQKVEAEASSIEQRVKALETRVEGYVGAHVVYLAAGIGFVVGAVLGHFVK